MTKFNLGDKVIVKQELDMGDACSSFSAYNVEIGDTGVIEQIYVDPGCPIEVVLDKTGESVCFSELELEVINA